MLKKAKNRAPSLLDSKYYQSALRSNQIENNKLKKVVNSLESDSARTSFSQHQDWENTQILLLKIKKTSGYADLEKYKKLFSSSKKKEDEITPRYYYMYGMRIGDKPKLRKNFLGKSLIKHTQINDKEKSGKCKFGTTKMNSFIESELEKDNQDTISDSSLKLNQIVIDGKVVTLYPIGYSKSAIKKHCCFISCTNNQLEEDRDQKPLYYLQKHKYIIPAVNMFR